MPALLRALPRREGTRPETTRRSPHLQLTDVGREDLGRRLVARARALPEVVEGPSPSSAEAVAFFVSEWEVRQPRAEAPFGGEFAHVHLFNGGSGHVVLPESWGAHATRLGWAEVHPESASELAPSVLFLFYGPRNEGDLLPLGALIFAAYARILALDPDDPAVATGRYLLNRSSPHARRIR